MKKIENIRKLFLVFCLVIIFSALSYTIYAVKEIEINKNLVLLNYEKVKMDFSNPIEVELSTELKMNETISVNDESKELLTSFNIDMLGEKKIKKVYDKVLDRTITRIISKDSEVDFDVNGDLVSYTNLSAYSVVDKDKRDYVENEKLPIVCYEIDDKSKLDEIISMIEKEANLDDYKLIECSNNIEGIWTLTWVREYDNGLINQYDCVNVSINAKDGSIFSFGRNKMLPNTLECKISEDTAINAALPIISKYGGNVDKVSLGFTRPNFFFEDGGPYEMANFVRLCYNVFLDNGIIVQIDAQTKEILGGDCEKGISARSMAVNTDFSGYKERAMLAEDAFNRLEYVQNYGTVYWTINQNDINWILARTDMYGLYLSCHGNISDDGTAGLLTDKQNWQLMFDSNTNYGIWRFVFLDACLSSASNVFANAFNCTNAGECFVGWNNSVRIYTAYDFARRFFPRLGTMTVHNAVVTSRDEAQDAGFCIDGLNLCNPGFLGDMNYYGWAW